MKYDVAIIGGGPAGLMAAGRAAELGAKVILLEKNPQPGLKLLMTGGGRCNLTNNILSPQLMAASFGAGGSFLLSAFSRFGVKETLEFFTAHGLKIKIEEDNKVFPASNQARAVLDLLLKYVDGSGGEIRTGAEIREIINTDDKINKLVLSGGEEIVAKNYILATGGQSYPLTGSTGAGYEWLADLGHTIAPLRPALAPIFVKEKFIKDLEGLSLEKIRLSLYSANKKIAQVTGDIIFTALGLSGPAALNLSRHADLSVFSDLNLRLDFFPQDDEWEADKRLQILFNNQNKIFKNSLTGLLAPRLVEVLGFLAGINIDQPANSITKIQRKALVGLLKSLRLEIAAIGGYDKAMVTVGGLDLKEIDPKTMRSKLISNLFVAGEVLDLTGPTGGFNLQMCWSTGYIAGEAAA